MTITLTREHEEVIADALRSGAYQSADEVIARALEILRDQEIWLAQNRAKIEEGHAAAQRGELIDGDEVRADLQAKKRAWLAGQRRG